MFSRFLNILLSFFFQNFHSKLFFHPINTFLTSSFHLSQLFFIPSEGSGEQRSLKEQTKAEQSAIEYSRVLLKYSSNFLLDIFCFRKYFSTIGNNFFKTFFSKTFLERKVFDTRKICVSKVTKYLYMVTSISARSKCFSRLILA